MQIYELTSLEQNTLVLIGFTMYWDESKEYYGLVFLVVS